MMLKRSMPVTVNLNKLNDSTSNAMLEAVMAECFDECWSPTSERKRQKLIMPFSHLPATAALEALSHLEDLDDESENCCFEAMGLGSYMLTKCVTADSLPWSRDIPLHSSSSSISGISQVTCGMARLTTSPSA
jgi:hypothetical protein